MSVQNDPRIAISRKERENIILQTQSTINNK